MERSAARARFVQWVDDGSPASSDGSANAVQLPALVEVLRRDHGRLPARTRLRLPGCHAPTYAHAACLLAWLVQQGLSTWEDLPEGISAVPVLLLGDGNGLVDDELCATDHRDPGRDAPSHGDPAGDGLGVRGSGTNGRLDRPIGAGHVDEASSWTPGKAVLPDLGDS